MKRLFTALSPLSNETEPVIKRPRLIVFSLSADEDITINPSDSQSEQDDNPIILISDSDSDDDQDIAFISSPLTNDAETIEEEQEINIENEHELIDLTEDEPNSPCCLSDKLEHDIERCPICLETLSDLQSIGVYLIITPCHHVMCTLCTRELLSTSSRCPLCRKNISSTTLMPYCILT